MSLPAGAYRMEVATGGSLLCHLSWHVRCGQIEDAVREYEDGTREAIDAAQASGLEAEVRERTRLGSLLKPVEFVPCRAITNVQEQDALSFGRWA